MRKRVQQIGVTLLSVLFIFVLFWESMFITLRKWSLKKKIIISLLSIILVIVLFIVSASIFGIPIFMFDLLENERDVMLYFYDPFFLAIHEHDDLMYTILVPIYPDTGYIGEPIPDSATTVQYFLENDLFDLQSKLDAIYQNAIQGDIRSRDQRQKAKDLRAGELIKLEKRLIIVYAALDVIAVYGKMESWEFTPEENQLLRNLVMLRRPIINRIK